MTSTDGSYLSKPDMSTRRRRLFTFTHPIMLSHCGSIVTTAAEGVEDDSPDEAGFRFLVLDGVWDGTTMQRVQQDGHDAVIGVWVNPTVIASAQVQAVSLLIPRSIIDPQLHDNPALGDDGDGIKRCPACWTALTAGDRTAGTCGACGATLPDEPWRTKEDTDAAR